MYLYGHTNEHGSLLFLLLLLDLTHWLAEADIKQTSW